jgi:phosphoenolpyruvate-protein phosphotransferase (PTS system enzyme I)
MLQGIPASPGIAIGRAFLFRKKDPPVNKIVIQDTGKEKERFLQAVEIAMGQIEKLKALTEGKIGKEKSQIFEAHLLMLGDLELVHLILSRIENGKECAEFALKSVLSGYGNLFEKMDNHYIRERILDLEDVGNRLLTILTGTQNVSPLEIKEECIIVADRLSPSEVVQINREKVRGFAIDTGGQVSHSVIILRTMEIPAVVGLQSATEQIKNGDLVIVDGDEGVLLINPDQAVIEEYRQKQRMMAEFDQGLRFFKEAESVTRDGRKVELTANIGNPRDLRSLVNNGAAGIGLFRTEFLYMNRNYLPSEAEQFEAYREVLKKMGDKPVVIRTFDLGGDKKPVNFSFKKEQNPSQGYRASRLGLDRKDIFKTQLRAILKASVFGNVKIMFPMISSLQELREAREMLAEVKDELNNGSISFKAEIPVGIMVEVPSAAIISDIFAREVDFFSIGTNDLMQYTLAVDRQNEKISYLYDPFNPAVLRLIKLVIDNARKEKKWVSMCGEMAGDIRFIPILLGFGLDEFSMATANLLKVKQIIRGLDYKATTRIADDVLKLATSDEIKQYIDNQLSLKPANQVI